MKTYLEITAAPLERPEAAPAPIPELCRRLEDGDCLELRWEKQEGRVRCLLGVEEEMESQAAVLLETGGCLWRTADAPDEADTVTLLSRTAEEQTFPVPGQAPDRRLLLQTVEPGNSDPLFFLLDHAGDGCGVCFLIRRSPGLPAAVLTRLERSGDPAAEALAHSGRLLEAVGCVFGSDQQQEFLAAEFCGAFHGLTVKSGENGPVDEDLFDAVDQLDRTFLPEEVEALTALTLSQKAGQGLPVNPDTLPGWPVPLPQGGQNSLLLGRTAAGKELRLRLEDLRRGVFLAGAPGSGKGNLLFELVPQLHQAGVDVLVIESAKEELHHLAKLLPELKVWQPSAGSMVFDPFALPEDVTVGEYRAALLQMLRAAFKLDGPLEELFSETLSRCLSRYGFSEESTLRSPGVTPWGLHEFAMEFRSLLDSRGYSQRAQADVRAAGLVRLNKLFAQDRAVFDTVVSTPLAEMIRGVNLLELNRLTTQEAKQLFATMFLVRLGTWMRLRLGHSSGLRLAILMDESHNLLQEVQRTTGEGYGFAADFSALLLELRSVGVGFLVADQSARNVPEQISAVCGTKIFMGGSSYSGVAEYGPSLGLDQTALDNLWRLGPGQGLFAQTGLPRPVCFSTKNLIDHFRLEVPCQRSNSFLKQHPRFCQETFLECGECPCRGRCTQTDKAEGRMISDRLLMEYGPLFGGALALPMQDGKDLTRRQKFLLDARESLFAKAGSLGSTAEARQCGVIQFARLVNRENRRKLLMKNMYLPKDGGGRRD